MRYVNCAQFDAKGNDSANPSTGRREPVKNCAEGRSDAKGIFRNFLKYFVSASFALRRRRVCGFARRPAEAPP
jgi:hypothetical protein